MLVRLSLFLLLSLLFVQGVANQVNLTHRNVGPNKRGKVTDQVLQVGELSRRTILTAEDFWRSYRARIKEDSLQVEVQLLSEVNSATLQALAASGGRVQLSRGRLVQMFVPISNLEWFESSEFIAEVRLPNYAEPLQIVSEGLDTLGVPRFHHRGQKGQGTRIAVIDGGFLEYWRYLGTELPINLHAVYFGSSFESDSKHGVQCAQVVYDVAPLADLWLIQFDTYLEFLATMDYVQEHGIDIVSCSMGFFAYGWPNGSSEMSQRIEVLKDNGILWVNAAGNHAQKHWRGNFSDTDFDGYHNFVSNDEGNAVLLTAGVSFRASLFWNDYPYSDQDFDMELIRASDGLLVANSSRAQSGTQSPEEFISYVPLTDGYYWLVIRKYSATSNPAMHLYVTEGASSLNYVVEGKSILLPSDSKGALTVGAVPWNNAGDIEEFSSRGPSEDSRIKPDLVAPDGIRVAEGFGYVSVSGTSFACPHVAGAAAIYLSSKPSVRPSAVADTFKTMCIDFGNPGPDNTFGRGLLHLRAPNSAPVLINPGNKSIVENSNLNFTLVASDPDNDPIEFSAPSFPSGASLNFSTGLFSWTPMIGQAGTYSVTFIASDGIAVDQETISIVVNASNRPPVLAEVGNKTVNEGQLLTFTLSASDPDSDPLAFSSTPLPLGAALSSATGDFVWQPSFEQSGNYTITFTVSDGSASDSKVAQISVVNVNRAPELTNPGSQTVAENSLLAFAVTAVDPDGDDVTLSATPIPSGASFDAASGTFVWQPNYEQSGTYGVTVSATDGQAVDQVSIQIVVTNVNRPPAAFSLKTPADGDTVRSTSATLRWSRTSDPDVGSTIRYLVNYSVGDTSTWQSTSSALVDTQYTIASLQAEATYFWKVRAEDNEGAITGCSKAFSFVVADISPPSFAVEILPNPVFTFELDFFIYPSEPLSGSVDFSIQGPAGKVSPPVVKLSNRDAICYSGDYTVNQSGTHLIEVCANDLANNHGCHEESFSASAIFANSETILESPSGATKLWLPAGSCNANGALLCRERPLSTSELGNAIMPHEIVPYLIVDYTSTIGFDNASIMMIVDPRVLQIPVGAGETMVVLLLDGTRTIISMRANLVNGTYLANIPRLGAYVIGVAAMQDLTPLPSSSQLDQNTPNPFNQGTLIPFTINEPTEVRLEVFNILGQRVANLLRKDLLPGNYSIPWDGTTESGEKCSSGTYFYRLSAASQQLTRKMLYLK